MNLDRLKYDHKDILSHCHVIRKEIVKKAPPKRLQKIAAGIYEQHLKSHFEYEEKHVFPILGNDHPIIIQAIREHQQIASICKMNDFSLMLAKQLISEMDAHIQFEERVVFPYVQQAATEEQLLKT